MSISSIKIMEPVFSLCVTLRGRYHWVYKSGFFYPNPCCDQAHGPCLRVIQFVALRLGTARSIEWVSSTSRRLPIRWGMLLPACGRVKGRKAPIVVGYD